MRHALPIAIVLALLLPASAVAGTASVSPIANYTRTLTYTAAPGEANRIVVTRDLATTYPYEIVVQDAAAAVVAGLGCRSVDEHTARCAGVPMDRPSYESGSVTIVVNAGDGDDTVAVPSSADPVATVRGGDGRDVLSGAGNLYGEAGNDALTGGTNAQGYKGSGPPPDYLEGGPGDDILRGTGYQTYLVGDGRGVAPGNDAISATYGGTVSYAERRAGVRIDLADTDANHGEPGERDRLSGIDAAVGGDGDDVLLGNERPNRLQGGLGDDRLVGRAGHDYLDGAAGADALDGGDDDDDLDGGAGRDTPRGGDGDDDLLAGSDGDTLDGGRGHDRLAPRQARSVSCGDGRDIVARPRGARLDGCETVEIGARRFPTYTDTLDVAATPERRGGALRFPWSCNATAGRCDLTVGVRRGKARVDRRSQVILERDGKGVIVIRPRRPLRRGQLVTVSIAGNVYSSGPPGGKTIPFTSVWRLRL